MMHVQLCFPVDAPITARRAEMSVAAHLGHYEGAQELKPREISGRCEHSAFGIL